jgi:hypothetical protein
MSVRQFGRAIVAGGPVGRGLGPLPARSETHTKPALARDNRKKGWR